MESTPPNSFSNGAAIRSASRGNRQSNPLPKRGNKNGATSLMSMLAIERFMILRSVAMFSDMPGDALLDLVQLLREEEVDAERVVIREDDYGSRLYIAVSGRYRVSRAGTLLAELG